MTKAEFIEKAKQNNYTDEQIQEFIDLKKETKEKLGYDMPYDKIILIEQPEY